MTYGESFVSAVRDYLAANKIVSLGGINSTILGDLAQRHHDHWQALNKPVKAPRTPKPPSDALSDAEWLKSLSESPANRGVDMQGEYEKAQFWVREQVGRRFTRRFFVQWLLKADRILPTHDAVPTSTSQPKSALNMLYSTPTFDFCRVIALKWPRDQFPDRPAYEEMAWKEIPLTVRQEVLRVARSA